MSPESLFWLLITTLYFSFFLFVCLLGMMKRKLPGCLSSIFVCLKLCLKKLPVNNVLRRTCINFFNEMTAVIYLYQ